LSPILHTFGVQRAPDEVIADARQVLDPAPSDKDDRVFLEVMSYPRDIARDFDIIGQTDSGHLAEGRVGLLWSGGEDPRANASFLRAVLQSRRLALVVSAGSAFPD
jgi:hypothetical protein